MNMNEGEILEILVDWNFWGNFDEKLVDRPAYQNRMKSLFGARAALVLLGVRRAGKSSIAYLFVKDLGKEFEANETLIVNFEDPRFPAGMEVKDLFNVYETYLKHLSPSPDHLVVLDEVQNVRGWEKFVRYLIESKKVKTIVTGSSSKLLGKEISTALTGRHVNMEVFPLDFNEFLAFNGLKLRGPLDIIKNRIKIQSLFDLYLKYGGFPEVVLSDSPSRKKELLTNYFEDITTKDIVKRFGIREIEKLEKLVGAYTTGISSFQSFNRLKNLLGISLDTVERYSKYLEIARMFIFVKKFEYSAFEQIRSVRKVYIIDPGFYYVRGFRFSSNLGKLMENLVAIELLRRKSRNTGSDLEIYYWKDHQQREVDFVLKSGLKIDQLIQVTYASGEEEIEKREKKALIKASEELNCDDMLVITWDYEAEEEFKGKSKSKRIKFTPLWKWLLEGII
jgi:predicted AAA+ superfamily ATPase